LFQKHRNHFAVSADLKLVPFAQSTKELERFGCNATAGRTRTSVFDATAELENADPDLVYHEVDQERFEDALEMNYEALRREVLDNLYYTQYIPTEIRQPEEYKKLLDILEQTQKNEVTSQEVSELWNRSELEKLLEEGGFMKVQSPEIIELALKQTQDMAATAQMLDGKEHLLQTLHTNLRTTSVEVEIKAALPAAEVGNSGFNEVFYDATSFIQPFVVGASSSSSRELPRNLTRDDMIDYPNPETIQRWKTLYGDTFGLCGGCYWPSFVSEDSEGKSKKIYINGHKRNAGTCNVTDKQLNKNALKSYKNKVKRVKLTFD
jgi:hypothetical protein